MKAVGTKSAVAYRELHALLRDKFWKTVRSCAHTETGDSLTRRGRITEHEDGGTWKSRRSKKDVEDWRPGQGTKGERRHLG
jgi:hypothetical protein